MSDKPTYEKPGHEITDQCANHKNMSAHTKTRRFMAGNKIKAPRTREESDRAELQHQKDINAAPPAANRAEKLHELKELVGIDDKKKE